MIRGDDNNNLAPPDPQSRRTSLCRSDRRAKPFLVEKLRLRLSSPFRKLRPTPVALRQTSVKIAHHRLGMGNFQNFAAQNLRAMSR